MVRPLIVSIALEGVLVISNTLEVAFLHYGLLGITAEVQVMYRRKLSQDT